jgi:hypothetical protein
MSRGLGRGTEPAPAVPAALVPSPLPSGAELRAAPVVENLETGCSFPDRGFGDYERWRPLRLGKLLVPTGRGLDDAGGFNLLVHFHGAEPIRKQLAPEGYDLVILGIDAGTLSSHYESVMSGERALDELIAAAEHEVAAATGRAGAHAKHLAISSWSAGYGAVGQVLARPHARLEGIVLLDSLHASYPSDSRRLQPGQLAAFVAWARAAADGGPLMYVTHSDVQPEDYASTRETAAFLLFQAGGERGRFFVRGYPGGGPEDHCAQLRLLPAILRDTLLPGWGG